MDSASCDKSSPRDGCTFNKCEKQKQVGSRYSVHPDKTSHSAYTNEIHARYAIKHIIIKPSDNITGLKFARNSFNVLYLA